MNVESSLSCSQRPLVAGISVGLLIIRGNVAALQNTQRVSIFLCHQVRSPQRFHSLTALSLSLSSYYLFLLIFRTKPDKIRDLEFRTVSTFSGACQVSPESSAVSVSVSPYSNSRLGDSMELCEEQERKKKTTHMSIYISSDTKH